jgi:hypothetical protein
MEIHQNVALFQHEENKATTLFDIVSFSNFDDLPDGEVIEHLIVPDGVRTELALKSNLESIIDEDGRIDTKLLLSNIFLNFALAEGLQAVDDDAFDSEQSVTIKVKPSKKKTNTKKTVSSKSLEKGTKNEPSKKSKKPVNKSIELEKETCSDEKKKIIVTKKKEKQ